jgi:hypothetical protein
MEPIAEILYDLGTLSSSKNSKKRSRIWPSAEFPCEHVFDMRSWFHFEKTDQGFAKENSIEHSNFTLAGANPRQAQILASTGTSGKRRVFALRRGAISKPAVPQKMSIRAMSQGPYIRFVTSVWINESSIECLVSRALLNRLDNFGQVW